MADILDWLRYEAETGRLFWARDKGRAKQGDEAGIIDAYGYRVIKIGQKRYRAHHIVWRIETGRWPTRLLYHKNNVRDDNRFCNLRYANESLNGCNRGKPSNNTSGHKNVTWCKQHGKWKVCVVKGGEQYLGGFFDCVDEAGKAAKKLRSKIHGRFANHA